MADFAEQGDCEVIEWFGEVVGDLAEEWFERVDEGVLEGVHGEGVVWWWKEKW